MTTKVTIGLDPGVASLGWSIVGDSGVIRKGVFLYRDAGQSDNKNDTAADRRKQREAGRQFSRRKERKARFFRLLKKFNLVSIDSKLSFIDQFANFQNQICKINNTTPILDLRLKGLTGKLNNWELWAVLYYYLSNAGYFYKSNAMTNKKDNKIPDFKIINRYKDEILEDHKQLRPVEIQKEFLKLHNFYRGTLGVTFSHNAVNDELLKILENQKLDQKFVELYLKIFEKRRDYSEGPASSPYGLCIYDSKQGKWVKNPKWPNLWTKNIGNCVIYPTEKRSVKRCVSSEVFNLLSQLNNLFWYRSGESEEKVGLSETQKRILLKDALYKSALTEKQVYQMVKKEFDWIEPEDIMGWPISPEKKVKFEATEISRWILKKLNNYNQGKDFDINNFYKIDELIQLFYEYKNPIKLKNELHDCLVNNFPNNINVLQSLIDDATKETKAKKLSGRHQFSLKALREAIPCLLTEERLNPSTLYLNQITDNLNNQFSDPYLKKFKVDHLQMFKDLTPSVKRSFLSYAKVLNNILKFCKKNNYEIETIVIELARDMNSKKQKKKISDRMQKEIKFYKNYFKNSGINWDTLSWQVKRKLKLYVEQDGIDLYTQKNINLEKLLGDSKIDNEGGSEYQIDHIIPKSISHDNSLGNLILTASKANSDKTNTTPYYWFSGQPNLNWKSFESAVIKLRAKYYPPKSKKNAKDAKDKTKSKKDYPFNFKAKAKKLLSKEDPYTISFVGRHLSDTRYLTKIMLQMTKAYFYKQNTHVISVNGKLTNYIRKKLDVLKYREIDSSHHAIDASLIALLTHNFTFLIKTITNFYYREAILLGNNMAEGDFNKSLFNQIDNKISKMKYKMDAALKDTTYYSWKKTYNKNFRFTAKQLTSIRRKNDGNYYTIKKINLLKADQKTLRNYFVYDEEQKKYTTKNILGDKDNKLYHYLCQIYKENYHPGETENKPFLEYMKQNYPNLNNESDDNDNDDALEVYRYLKVEDSRLKQPILVKKLMVIEESNKDKKEILFDHYNNNKAGRLAFEWKKMRIYRTAKNKWYYFPYTARNVIFTEKKAVWKDEKNNFNVNKYLRDNGVVDPNKYIEITKNQIVIDDKGYLLYLAGGTVNRQTLEFIPLDYNYYNEKITYKDFLSEFKVKTSDDKISIDLNEDLFFRLKPGDIIYKQNKKYKFIKVVNNEVYYRPELVRTKSLKSINIWFKKVKFCNVDFIGNIYDQKNIEKLYDLKYN